MAKINYKGFILSERMTVKEFLEKNELIPYDIICYNGNERGISLHEVQKNIDRNCHFEVINRKGHESLVVVID